MVISQKSRNKMIGTLKKRTSIKSIITIIRKGVIMQKIVSNPSEIL